MLEKEQKSENSILYEVLVYHEWHQENEGVIKKARNDGYDLFTILSSLNPLRFLRRSICSFDIKSVTDLPWKFAVSQDGTLVAVLQENLLEIRATRDEFTSVIRKISVTHDQYPQLRLMAWSPDSTILAVARENVINLFNLLGNNLATFRQNGVENPVIGLTFLNTKFISIKWSCELLIVTFDGTVRSFLYSAVDGLTEENIQFSLNSHYPKGISCVAYHPEHHMLFVAGHHCCGKGRNGITAWRLLNDSPFLKLAFGLEADELGPSRWRSLLRMFVEPSEDTIKKMKISPEGRNLACLHSNGSVSIWSLPGVKLTKIWLIHDQPGYDALATWDKPAKNDQKFWPVDIDWWSQGAVIIVRKNGAVTVCSIVSLENLLGEGPEFLSGPPQVASVSAEERVILLDCNVVVNHRNQFVDDDEEAEPEEDAASVLQETIQSALYMVTDIETFQPRKRAVKHVQKTYTLVGLNAITSEILFHREIESGAYESALMLAEKYDLDSDLVYQRQWQMTPITPETIEGCLSRIKRKDWIANECIRCVPDTYDAALKLLQFGLQITRGEDSEQASKISAYLDALHLYEQILPTRDHYDKNEYDELRSMGTLEAAVKYARDGRRDALRALLSLRTSLIFPHWLPILSNFPETLNPKHYRELLPKFESGSCENWKRNWADTAVVKNFTSIFEENENVIYGSCPHLRKFQTDELGVDVMYDWMKTRAYEIDEFSGSVENALMLVRLVIENGVPDSGRFLNHLRSLDHVVTCIDESVGLKYWDSLDHLEQALLLMKDTKPSTFIVDIKKKLVPFVSCVECDACSLIADLVCRFAANGLELPLVFLTYLKKSGNGRKESVFRLNSIQKMRLALDCLYAYPRDNQLDKCWEIFECLPDRSENCDEHEIKLHKEVDELGTRLLACETLSNMGYPKSLNYLKSIANDAERSVEVIRLAAAAAAQHHPKSYPNLLNDLLDIQAAIPLVDTRICHELYVRYCLINADPLILTPAESFLTLKRQVPKMVPFDRSVELIIEAATAHFDTSTHFERIDANPAWQILSLVREPIREIKELKGLIRAMGIIRSDVLITPLNLRRMANRWQLLEKCIRASSRIYKNEFIALAECLGLEDSNRSLMEGQAYTIAANHAYELGDFEYCVYLCGKIVNLDYAPAWDIVQKIGKLQEYFQPKTLDFLAFAILHCPRDFIEDLIETRISFRKLQTG